MLAELYVRGIVISILLTSSCMGQLLNVPNGGTGRTSLTNHSILLGQGTADVAFVGPTGDAVPLWRNIITDPVPTVIPDCATALIYSQTTHLFNCNAALAGVSSITGDGLLITNVASVGAVTLTVGTAPANKFWNGAWTQPAFTNLSGSLACTQMPALTGDTTSSAGTCATSTVKVNGASVPVSAALVSTNGSGQLVAASAATSPIVVSATGGISCPTCGTGSGTVTSVTGVAPIASTGGATPAISIQNSGSTNITSSLGTDTKISTWSGSASTAGQVALGDTSGGGKWVTMSGDCTISSSGVITCLPNTSAVGGIIGGTITTANAPSAAPFTNALGINVNPQWGFQMVLSGLTVWNTAAGPTANTNFWFGYAFYNISSLTDEPGQNRTTMAVNTAINTSTVENANIRPFVLGAGYKFGIKGQVGNNTSTSGTTGWATNVGGLTYQPISTVVSGSLGVAGGGSDVAYILPIGTSGTAVTTETLASFPIPDSYTARNMCITTNTSQPANNSMSCKLRLAHGGVSFADTSIIVTVTAGGTAGQWCDATDTAALVAGDHITWKCQNLANATSASINGITMALDVSAGSSKGFVEFIPQGTVTISTAKWFPPYSSSAGFANASEASARGPSPRSMTVQNCYIDYTTPPGTNAVTGALAKDGVTGSISISVPTTGSGLQQANDTTHTMSLTTSNGFDIGYSQSSGTGMVTSATVCGVY